VDELKAIRSFRDEVSAWDEDVRRVARTALISQIKASDAGARRARWSSKYIFSSGQSRRWQRVAVIAAVVLLTGLTAASALALYDFVAGEPAPTPIAEQLAEEGRADPIFPFFAGIPDVMAKSAHGVAAVETSAGRAILWAATGDPSPVCYFVEFETLTSTTGRPQGKAHCGTRLSTGVPIAYKVSRVTVASTEVAYVVGWVHDHVASVVLRAPDGTERELGLSERFFVAEMEADLVPERPGTDGNRYSLIAKDTAGAEVQRVKLDSGSSNLPVVPRSVGARRTVIETIDSRGRPMSLSLFPIEGGATCVEIETANGTTGSCQRQVRTDEGIDIRPTLLGSLVYLRGSVGPEVASLELRHEDGFVLKLSIVDRFVLYDVPRERFVEGKRPTLLVAKDSDGAEVGRRIVPKRRFAIRPESAGP
jgi:hypothetical protein